VMDYQRLRLILIVMKCWFDALQNDHLPRPSARDSHPRRRYIDTNEPPRSEIRLRFCAIRIAQTALMGQIVPGIRPPRNHGQRFYARAMSSITC
jgi:hypothetical protein